VCVALYPPPVSLTIDEITEVLQAWEQARRYAEQARRAADTVQDAALVREAAELVEVIEARVPAPAQDDGPDPARAAWLVRRMRDKLQKWRAPGERSGPPGADTA